MRAVRIHRRASGPTLDVSHRTQPHHRAIRPLGRSNQTIVSAATTSQAYARVELREPDDQRRSAALVRPLSATNR
jgi:hypothetical protein